MLEATKIGMKRFLNGFVQQRECRIRTTMALRDALDACRDVTTWGGGLGRGPQNELAAGRFNRACYAVDSFILDIVDELWAIGTLDRDGFAEWTSGR